jgi:hypothetical protein
MFQCMICYDVTVLIDSHRFLAHPVTILLQAVYAFHFVIHSVTTSLSCNMKTSGQYEIFPVPCFNGARFIQGMSVVVNTVKSHCSQEKNLDSVVDQEDAD